METRQRENWIDNAKGIAMICVMVGHLGRHISYGPWGLGFVYGFHLAVFFLLSGYTFKKAVLDKEYIKKKFKRLMVPYFVTCIAIIIMSVITEIAINQDATILTATKAIGRNILSSFYASGSVTNYAGIEAGIRIGAIWFLPAMFLAIIFFQFILNKFDTTTKRLLISIALALVGYVSAKLIWLPFSIQPAMFATPFICAGYEIKAHDLLKKIKWPHYIIAGVLLIAGIALEFCYVSFVGASAIDLIISIIVAFAGSLLVYLLAKHVDKIKIIGYIGRISIYVMCVHLFLLEACKEYFRTLAKLIIKDNGSIANIDFYRLALNAILQFILSIAIAILIDQIVKKFKAHQENYKLKVAAAPTTRDKSIDILRGLFIIAMIVGHFGIDNLLIKTIYSCHMAAFVFVSGYFYNENRSIKETLKTSAKTLLIPYAVFAIIQILINAGSWSGQYFGQAAVKYITGVILTKDILTSVQSIGPAWFILMLFVTKILYTCIQKLCKKEWITSIVVVVLSFAGAKIGEAGFWLPWSIDVALYALVFYHIGHLFKKYKLLDFFKENYIFYFLLTPVWAFMIYKGSTELSRRNYGEYGLMIIGAIAGILTTYLLCNLLSDGCPQISKILADFGKGSMYVLLIHTLLDEILRMQLIKIIPQGNIAVMLITIAIELLVSYGVIRLIDLAKNNVKAKKV